MMLLAVYQTACTLSGVVLTLMCAANLCLLAKSTSPRARWVYKSLACVGACESVCCFLKGLFWEGTISTIVSTTGLDFGIIIWSVLTFKFIVVGIENIFLSRDQPLPLWPRRLPLLVFPLNMLASVISTSVATAIDREWLKGIFALLQAILWFGMVCTQIYFGRVLVSALKRASRPGRATTAALRFGRANYIIIWLCFVTSISWLGFGLVKMDTSILFISTRADYPIFAMYYTPFMAIYGVFITHSFIPAPDRESHRVACRRLCCQPSPAPVQEPRPEADSYLEAYLEAVPLETGNPLRMPTLSTPSPLLAQLANAKTHSQRPDVLALVLELIKTNKHARAQVEPGGVSSRPNTILHISESIKEEPEEPEAWDFGP